jgi:hypothetical protein
MNVGYRMSYLLQIPVEILGLIKSRVPEGLFLTNTHHYAMIHRTMGISHVFLTNTRVRQENPLNRAKFSLLL